MANEEHLAILEHRVPAWNKWRKENPLIRPDLIGTNLHDAYLGRANLSGANCDSAGIGMTVFADVDLSKVKGLDTAQHFKPSSIGVDTIYDSIRKFDGMKTRHSTTE